MMSLGIRIEAKKLNDSLIFKLKSHLIRPYLHAVLSHTELLNEPLHIKQVGKRYAVFQTQLIVALSKFV